ncbi:MAG: hypothetical protein L3J34_11615 [Flavobacteriaceae bacterium]|nr:hypothetical protein [Flavobacteriaceae bacterium]
MKKLELEQMESLEGGGFITGMCSGIAIASFMFFAGAISFGVGSAIVLGAAGAACASYSIF